MDRSIKESRGLPSGRKQSEVTAISLPKGGGAIKGIDEKFSVNPATGTGSLAIPIFTTPSRSDFYPKPSLSYDSGSGNGPFGFGWNISTSSIVRKTDKGLPRYRETEESDVFMLSGAEDLVPELTTEGGMVQRVSFERTVDNVAYTIQRFRPRVEGSFARIERWRSKTDGAVHWRVISPDNVTTLYGRTEDSRIVDPSDRTRIFSWLICESYDDIGNIIVYEYKKENLEDVHHSLVEEKNRVTGLPANRYLKRIKYGNQHSRLLDSDLAKRSCSFELVFDYGEHQINELTGQRFAVDFEGTTTKWSVRQDRFSNYRAGFEVRTYRRCERVLMFHHFPAELGVPNYLVRSTDFAYDETPIASFLKSVSESGYVRNSDDTYLKRSLPPVEFKYSPAKIDEVVREVEAENLPQGLDDALYRWVDLDGEGLSGVLTENHEAWYYNRNNGGASFGPVNLVAERPSIQTGENGSQFLDLSGNGRLYLVEMRGSLCGFFERTGESKWSLFVPFVSWPFVDTSDPNVRFVDLNGDGHADLLITEEDAFTWHASLAEKGFGPANRVSSELNEEKGPRLIFDDGTESIYLSDMSGDGLSDLVRIRNGDVCYWPNLGYGRFGSKVTMGGAPIFDAADQFDQKRLRLADIDGSGVTDLIYLGRDEIRFWFNESGNSWGAAHTLTKFPATDNVASVQVVDLLGNGTACIVWSSPLPSLSVRPMLYVDLMSGQKPHLLVSVTNNLGAESKISYAPSTEFYLADKRAGRPWVTRLPFPVQVVKHVETHDYVSRNHFVTRYHYHHGYFDGVEREFRGFGMVEQFDTEDFGILDQSQASPRVVNFDNSFGLPPILTRTWFHTGAYLEGERISGYMAHEYYSESDASDSLTPQRGELLLLNDAILPASIRRSDGSRTPHALSVTETVESCRALKGAILRQEVYALDKTDAQLRPYTVSEHNYTIELLQPQAINQHAVFFSHARETINFLYERKLFAVTDGLLLDPSIPAAADFTNAADPRVTHSLNLAVDQFGNVLQSVAIAYGRRFKDLSLRREDQSQQAKTFITFTDNTYTNRVTQADDYRLPELCDSRTYEIVKATPSRNSPDTTNLFSFDELVNLLEQANDGLHDLPYQDLEATAATEARPYRRLIEHLRTLFRSDNLTGSHEGLLPLGLLESKSLPGESYKLAFSQALLALTYRRGAQSLLANPDEVLKTDGGYVSGDDLSTDGLFPSNEPRELWWLPAGRNFFSVEENSSAAAELNFARQNFFLPHRFSDPFNYDTTVSYDDYLLAAIGSTDALQNKTSAVYDYRVLRPFRVIDPNDNVTEIKFDALGIVTAIAVQGAGDKLDDIESELTPEQIDGFFDSEDPHVPASELLGNATSRFVYDLDRFRRTRLDHPNHPSLWLPSCSATITRETHVDQSAGGLKLQVSFSYSDGFGREIQKKIQAEPGPLIEGGPRVNQRWVGSGWTIFNNKGKPVREFEPFFSLLPEKRHRFEFGITVGVGRTLFYDPLERVVATLHPNHTYEKVVFDPWSQSSFDVNDTVTFDPVVDRDVSDFFKRLPETDYLPSWHQRNALSIDAAERIAAEKASKHGDTPSVAYIDSLGRTFLTIVDNGKDNAGLPQKYPTRVLFDIEGNQREIRDAIVDTGDARGRTVMRYDYDMLGNRTHQASMDAGERWLLNDVVGKTIRSWDSRNHEFIHKYDELRRPIETRVRGGENQILNHVFEKTAYGEGKSLNGRTDQELNLRGKPFEQYDTAGKIRFEEYDFKGNLLKSRRWVASSYKEVVQWDVANPELFLDGESFTTETKYDALNRVIWTRASDRSITRPAYNEANLLESLEVEQDAQTIQFVTNINYNARGQRTDITFGNGIKTSYEYEPETFRLRHLETRKVGGELLQDLRYTYDPIGNITQIEDRARPTIFFGNVEIRPVNSYTYDPLYRLIAAEGREHTATVECSAEDNWNDLPFLKQYSRNDPMAWRNYDQTYRYDAVGNIQQVKHIADNGSWTRDYVYETANNRLKSTNVRLDQTTCPAYEYEHHPRHGFMTKMPHLQVMEWNFKDEFQAVARQRQTNGMPETTYYVYDASGQRIRKITEMAADAGAQPVKKKECIYLGAVEIYREYTGNNAGLERKTLHVMDDKRRIAMIETRNDVDDRSPKTLVRYQFSNHLGTACLETDGSARVISYEEYHPYGTTSYQAVDRDIKAAAKRYRYSAKERDDESGFYYYGARYYVPWLGRWTSCEPKSSLHYNSSYGYAAASPVTISDPDGRAPTKRGQLEAASLLAIDEDNSVKSGGSPTDPANKRFTPQQDNASKGEKCLPDKAKSEKKRIKLADMKAQGKLDAGASHMLSRNFDETAELDAIAKRAEEKTKKWAEKTGLNPDAEGDEGKTARRRMADKANQRIRAEIRKGTSPEATIVREALGKAKVNNRLRIQTVNIDRAAESPLTFKDVRASVDAKSGGNTAQKPAKSGSGGKRVVALAAVSLAVNLAQGNVEGAAMSGGLMVAQRIPGVGLALSAASLDSQLENKDYVNAAITVASVYPPFGVAAAVGYTAADVAWAVSDRYDLTDKFYHAFLE